PPPLPLTRTHTAAWRGAVRRSFQAMPGPARRASGTGLLTMPRMGTCVREVECWLSRSPWDEWVGTAYWILPAHSAPRPFPELVAGWVTIPQYPLLLIN